MIKLLLLGLLLLPAAASAQDEELTKVPPPPQGQCFCIRRGSSNNGIQQYSIDRSSNDPTCLALTYDSHGLAPWDNGLPICADSAAGNGFPQRRCFCTQASNNGAIRQFRVVAHPTAPECGAPYESHNLLPWENDILDCRTMVSCETRIAECKRRLDALVASMSGASPSAVAEIATRIARQTARCEQLDYDCFKKPLPR